MDPSSQNYGLLLSNIGFWPSTVIALPVVCRLSLHPFEQFGLLFINLWTPVYLCSEKAARIDTCMRICYRLVMLTLFSTVGILKHFKTFSFAILGILSHFMTFLFTTVGVLQRCSYIQEFQGVGQVMCKMYCMSAVHTSTAVNWALIYIHYRGQIGSN